MLTPTEHARESTATGRVCTICGSSAFSFGGLERAKGGPQPFCLGCKSLERHRIIHAAYQPLLPLIRTWNAFQFAPDASISPGWFARFNASHFDGPQPVDMMRTGFEDSSLDLIIANHVLEHVSDDRQALAESLRVVGPNGIVHISVPDPMWLQTTKDWGFADPAQNQHYRRYGADFPMLVRRLLGDVLCLGVTGRDPVTETSDIFYFLSRGTERLTAIGDALQAAGTTVTRFWLESQGAQPATPASRRGKGRARPTTKASTFEELLEAARNALRDRHLAKAERRFTALCESWPDRSAAFAGLAETAQARGDWQLACERWQDCLTRFPAVAPIGWRLAHAWSMLHAGRHESAEAAFSALSETASDDSRPLAGLAQSMLRQERWSDAIPLFERLIERFPESVIPYWRLSHATCLERAGRLQEALTAYADLVAAHPDNENAQHCYVWLLDRFDRSAAAVASQRALESLPRSCRLLIQSVWLAVWRNEPTAAKTSYRSAVAAAATIAEIEELFSLVPSVSVGWERTSMWLDLSDRLSGLIAKQPPKGRWQGEVLAMRLRLALRDHNGFLQIFDHAPAGHPTGIWMERLGKVAAYMRAKRPLDLCAQKVFCIGLGSTGTTSMMVALDILGFHAAHYYNYFTCEQLSLEDAFLFDALGDIPVCVIFESLYYLFPNSKFIYTTRPLESWLTSIKTFREHRNWVWVRPGSNSPDFNLLTASHGSTEPLLSPQRALLFGSLWSHHPDDTTARQAFEVRVETFFSAHDRSRLMVFDMFSGDDWEKLCGFVERPVPDVAFPFENID